MEKKAVLLATITSFLVHLDKRIAPIYFPWINYFLGTEENFEASAPYFLFLFSIGVATLCWEQKVSF